MAFNSLVSGVSPALSGTSAATGYAGMGAAGMMGGPWGMALSMAPSLLSGLGGFMGASRGSNQMADYLDFLEQAGKSTATNTLGQMQMGQNAMTPYSLLGASSLPMYQYLTTGSMPNVSWSDADATRLADLSGREGSIQQQIAEMAGQGRTRSGSFFKNIGGKTTLSGLNAELNDLADLRQREAMYNSMQGIGGNPYDMITMNPTYQWEKAQGEQALKRAGAGMGNLITSNMLGSQSNNGLLGGFNLALNASYTDRLKNDLLGNLNTGIGASQFGANLGQSGASNAGNALMGAGAAGAPLVSPMAGLTSKQYTSLADGFGSAIDQFSPLNRANSRIASYLGGLSNKDLGNLIFS